MSLLVSKKAIKREFNTIVDIDEGNFKGLLWSCLCFARSKDINGNFTRYYAYNSENHGPIVLCTGANTWGTTKQDLQELKRLGTVDDIESYLKGVM